MALYSVYNSTVRGAVRGTHFLKKLIKIKCTLARHDLQLWKGNTSVHVQHRQGRNYYHYPGIYAFNSVQFSLKNHATQDGFFTHFIEQALLKRKIISVYKARIKDRRTASRRIEILKKREKSPKHFMANDSKCKGLTAIPI